MPPEGLDQAANAFANEIAPASRPRDQAGRFVATAGKPEPIFQPRAIEGDGRGDASDGGADPRLIEHERRVADGRSEEGDERKRLQDAARARDAAGDDGYDGGDESPPERVGAKDEADDAGEDAQREDEGAGPEGTPGEDEGPKYQIEINGQPAEVSLNEALKGYVREKTYNERMGRLSQVAQAADAEMARAMQVRDQFIARLEQQEAEFAAILPKEPDWDALFRSDPQGAHALQKNFGEVYGKLNAIRAQRQQAIAEAAQDYERRTAEYAKGEFTRFVQGNRINDEASLKKELGSMRQTALAAGFSEHEIATVYDSRMLTILRKASKYDRMMANKPLPVVPGKGKTLTPGAAPRIGDSTRRTFDDAQRKLASSGRLEDAEALFARMLR